MLRKASFWSFKGEVERFLLSFKKANRLTAFPWSEQDIIEGDFERSFEQACRSHMGLVREAFKSDELMHVEQATWHMQFGQLTMQDDERDDLDRKIRRLTAWSEKRAFVLALMLGVTNHWTSMAVVRHQGLTVLWHFDSKNRHFLNCTTSALKRFL